MTESLAHWLDAAFASPPDARVIAFCVNLYDSPFRADIIGATHYSATDPDWACDETWRAGIPPFQFADDVALLRWDERLELVKGVLTQCLEGSGRASEALRHAKVVAVGFVDGDLLVVAEADA